MITVHASLCFAYAYDLTIASPSPGVHSCIISHGLLPASIEHIAVTMDSIKEPVKVPGQKKDAFMTNGQFHTLT